jgi:transcriptional regulator with XRE-family HTH domain
MNPGAEIRAARRTAGFSQAQLARLGGTSQPTLAAYETGRKQPSVATLSRLLAVAGVRLEAVRRPRREPDVSPAELGRRGETLVAVMDLADELPTKHDRLLRYPPRR